MMVLFISTLSIIYNGMRLLLLLTLLLNLSAVFGQTTPIAPNWAQAPVVLTISELPQQGVLLDKNWKWQAGDNSQWANADFPDQTWPIIELTRDINDSSPLNATSMGWLRLRFSTDSTWLRESLALVIQQSGASEIYLNGQLLHRLGVVSAEPEKVIAFDPLWKPISLPLRQTGEQVLAVRFAFQPGIHYTNVFENQNPAFWIQVKKQESADAFYQQYLVYVERFHVFMIGVCCMLAILHVAFYRFDPSRKANLYFGMWAVLMLTGNVLQRNLLAATHQVADKFYVANLSCDLYEISGLLMLSALYQLLEQRKDKLYWGLVIWGLAGLLLNAGIYGWGWKVGGVLPLTFCQLNIARIAWLAIRRKKEGAWIIGIGAISYVLFFLAFVLPGMWGNDLFNLEIANRRMVFYSLAMMSIPVATSIYLGLDFALLSRALQQQLIEVKNLSREKQQLLTTQNEMLEVQLTQRTQEIQQQSRLLEQQHIRQLETEFEHKLADTEMTALRAQMNPHFIFNCLNSIKLYTLDNDADRASDYLTKFSRLIRLVLENSRSEMVPLQNELEALQLYIELEAMRFKQKVQFAIQVSPNIDQRYVCIPPLLLQPYVENAIWHGLMHKAEGGTVTVEVGQPQDNLLHIEITDDGVGRQRAGELKSKSAGKHKSFGMQVTADRIRMINQLYNIHTQTRIVDLVDSFGDACGTRVVLEIPL